jgi:type II secretory pathway predicted ATPase ExeA
VASPFDRGGKPDGIAPGVLGPVPHDLRTTGLTYEPFYGLKEKPFSLTSDARFFYQSRSHAPAFDNLLHAIKRRESLTVLTGDIGTGKTTLCRAVLQSLDRKTFSAFVTDPFASREELLKVLLTDFGVASSEDLTTGRFRSASRTELSYLLYDFLGTLVPLQAFAVVFIDEAQNLSLPLLEEVRILSDADGQLQVVLVGQLEFREKLRLPQMRQLDQRVSVHCRLEPLDVAGVAGYISHRLHRAGGSADRVAFSGDAVEAIYELSGGVPRVINKLCDRALHLGHTRRVSTIDVDIVRDSNPEAVPPPAEPVIAPVSMTEIPAPAPAPVVRQAAAVVLPPAEPLLRSPDATPRATDLASRPAEPTPRPAEPAPRAAEPAPPSEPHVASSMTDASVASAIDSVDRWLARVEDKAAAKAKATKSLFDEPDDPSAWRERWAPTDAVSPPEPERFRYRVRIPRGSSLPEHHSAQAGTGPRQFAAVLATIIVLALAVLAGPSLVRASVRVVQYLNDQFSAPLPPAVPDPTVAPVAFPTAPSVPDGPY